MTKNSILVILLVGLFFSCGKNEKCSDNYIQLETIFNKSLKILKETAKNEAALRKDDFFAVSFLEKTSKIKGKVDYGYISIYYIKDFNTGKRKWQKWLKTNRCSFSDEEVEKISEEINQALDWFSD